MWYLAKMSEKKNNLLI